MNKLPNSVISGDVFRSFSGRGRGCEGRLKERGQGQGTHRFLIPFPAPAAAPLKSLLCTILLLLLPTLSSAQATELLREAHTASASRQSAIATELTSLRLSEFEPEAAGELSRLFAREALGNATTYVKIAGFLQREDLLDGLSEQLRERKDVRRAANLARVRCGNVAKRDNLLKNLAEIRVDDDFVYTVIPLLVYTRDRAILDYVWEITMTESRNCHPADAEMSGRIDCAYRIVEQLGVAIEKFPVGIDSDHNLITSDYAGSLAEIRRWYAANGSDYTIDTQTY